MISIKKILTKGAQLWLHIDSPLLTSLILLIIPGLVILYSAGNQDTEFLFRQLTRLALALIVLFIVAQIPPHKLRIWTPSLFIAGITALLLVLLLGHTGKGAQRWLDTGFFRFQPSEVMKLAVPMMIAWFIAQKPLPPKIKPLLICSILVFIPTILIAKQPDLGTALLVAAAGFAVILLAGLKWRIVFSILALAFASLPFLWHMMHDYQKSRVLTFLNPERDPLGSGYHIIQSKIAIGSGGLFGKGWLNGSQSQLQFLPEHATDFIFAVAAEEFGLIGALTLIILFAIIIGRGLYISIHAQDTYTRLLAGSITLTFFVSVFINIGMVTGLLPIVGLPLPLVSYGGSSMMTMMVGFGILMSIQTHRKLVTT